MHLNPLPALFLALGLAAAPAAALAQASFVQTPYKNPKALFDIYLDHPAKMGAALHWLRSFMNPLGRGALQLLCRRHERGRGAARHRAGDGGEKNEAKYEEVVQRMRYYAQQGVKFKVCGLALQDFGYRREDLQPFVEVTPSAMTELVHWQNQGYGLITPVVTDKKLSIEEIR